MTANVVARPKYVKRAGTDFPSRNCLDLYSQAEKAIADAVNEVEHMGCDVRLTEAVVLLQKAKDRVADFVERAD